MSTRNSIIGTTVNTNGDRGVGTYQVIILKRKKGKYIDTEEEVYKAQVTKVIQQAYNYKVDDIVFVYRVANTPSLKLVGTSQCAFRIDPFIK